MALDFAKGKISGFILVEITKTNALGKIMCWSGYLEAIRLHFEARIGFLAPNLVENGHNSIFADGQLLPRNFGGY